MFRTAVTLSTAIVLIVASVFAQTPTQKPAPAAVLKALQGEWVIATINGQALADSGTAMSLTFTGDKYTQTVNGDVTERGTFKVDASKKPIAIDLAITEGDDAGKSQLGVLEVTGDMLTVHFNLPDATVRPADFTPQGQILVVARKHK